METRAQWEGSLTSRKNVHCNSNVQCALSTCNSATFNQVAYGEVAMDNSSCNGQSKLQFKLQGTTQVAIQVTMDIVAKDYFLLVSVE